MTITPHVFAAYLKCTTKCWLRAVSENATGNAYAEWIQAQNESYRADGLNRLLSAVTQHECVISSAAVEMKTAKWRLAVDVPVRTEEFPLPELRSSRRQEALTEKSEIRNRKPEIEIGLVTSAAVTNGDEPQPKWTVEFRLHAVERVPSEGRGKPAQFIPVRFVFTNKLGKDDKLLLAFDALALSKLLQREVGLGKIIHGDDRSTFKLKTSALAGEVRKRLEKIAALLSSPVPPDLVLNQHCTECEFQTRCGAVGRLLAFLASRSGEDARLWVRALDSVIAQELAGTDGAIGSRCRSRIGLELSRSEEELLERLSFYLRWGGRYPADTQPGQAFPYRISEDDMADLQRLVGRIRARYE